LKRAISFRARVSGALIGTKWSIPGDTPHFERRPPRPEALHGWIRDGAVNVSIRRPESVAVRTTLPDGAASVQLDERHISPISSQTPVQSSDYSDATDRYDVEIHGGAAKLTIVTS